MTSDAPPSSELRFPIWTGVSGGDIPPEWRIRTSTLGFREPGCYAVQVDGLNFSRTIVFRAEAMAPSVASGEIRR